MNVNNNKSIFGEKKNKKSENEKNENLNLNIETVLKNQSNKIEKEQKLELVDIKTIDTREVQQISEGLGFDEKSNTFLINEDKLTLREDMELTLNLFFQNFPNLLMRNSILSESKVEGNDSMAKSRRNILERLESTGLITKFESNYILVLFQESQFYDYHNIGGPICSTQEDHTKVSKIFADGKKRLLETQKLVLFLEEAFKKELYKLPPIKYTNNIKQAYKLSESLSNKQNSLTVVDLTNKKVSNGGFKTREELSQERKKRLQMKAFGVKQFKQEQESKNEKTLMMFNYIVSCFDINAQLLANARACPLMAYALYDMLNLQWYRFVVETLELQETNTIHDDVIDNLYYNGALSFALIMSELRPFAEEIAKECKFELTDELYDNFMKDNGELLQAIKDKRNKLAKSKLKQKKVVQLKVEKKENISVKIEEEKKDIQKIEEEKIEEIIEEEEKRPEEKKKLVEKEITVKKPTKKEKKMMKLLEKTEERKQVVEQYKTEKEKVEEEKLKERISSIKNAYKIPDEKLFADISKDISKTYKEILDIIFGLKENDKVIDHTKVIALARHLNQILSKHDLSVCGAGLVSEVKNRIHVRHDKDEGSKLPKHYVEVLRASFILFGIIPEGWKPQTKEDFDALDKLNTRHFYWSLLNSEE